MKSFAYTIFCLLTFSIFGFGQTTTVTLEPTDDVYWQNGVPKDIEILQLKYGKQHAFLKFDLSSINGEITKASLKLTATNQSYIGPMGIYEGDRNDWEEETVSGSNKPKRASENPLGTISYFNHSSIQSNYAYETDLETLWTSTDEVTLMIFRMEGRARNLSGEILTNFASKEHENETFHPQLILEIDGTVDDGGDDNGDDNPTDDGDNDDNGAGNGDNSGGDNGNGDGGNDNGGGSDDDNGNGTVTESVWNIKEDGTIYYNGGSVGIGTETPVTKFVVDGEIRATKVRVRGDVNLPDYVFEEDYNLRSLEEVETYIEQNGHLPEVPSARQVEAEGLSLGDMDATLLKKVEELTLYLIEMKKQNEELKKEVEALKKQLKQ
ncbi:MAG: DNRLRE domain-containing protein [Bacteroidota bacterium]